MGNIQAEKWDIKKFEVLKAQYRIEYLFFNISYVVSANFQKLIVKINLLILFNVHMPVLRIFVVANDFYIKLTIVLK